jgi:hypothetical protein
MNNKGIYSFLRGVISNYLKEFKNFLSNYVFALFYWKLYSYYPIKAN